MVSSFMYVCMYVCIYVFICVAPANQFISVLLHSLTLSKFLCLY